MSSRTRQKAQQEEYTYSWFLPAPGSEHSVQLRDVPQDSAETEQLEQGATPEVQGHGDLVAAQAGEGRTASTEGSIFSRVKGMGVSQMRVVGLVGWSAVAAAGVAFVLSSSGPSMGLHLGALGGVWVAASAAIWFLPSKL
jgi:hypothetical protein